jgi:uncharacterized membrane protein HdeD (DUF308 family)
MSSASKPVVRSRSQRKQAEADLGFNWRPLNTGLLVLGVVLLLVGYLALSKGSITLAPIVLVAGYVLVIPAALVLLGSDKAPGE